MNHYKGVSKSTIDRRVREAKARLLEKQIDERGYNWCVDCGVNGSNTRLDCSHRISVKDCQELKHIPLELAWDEDENLDVLCRECHQRRDKLDVKLEWK